METGQALRNAEALFKGKQRNEALRKTLPEAWSKLIDEHDPRLLDLLTDTTEKLCGYKPDTEELKKFLKSLGNSFLTQENYSHGRVKISNSEKGNIFTCRNKGAHAFGRYSSGRFIVLKGSTAILNETKTIKISAKKERDTLRKKDILKADADGNFLFFVADYEFNSPSAAAGVVLARSASGKIEWKNENGETLGQLVEK